MWHPWTVGAERYLKRNKIVMLSGSNQISEVTLRPLIINSNGGPEVPVFHSCLTVMIEGA